ncbi:MAG: sulfite exporter TauE/SafE family protein [Candidatus Methylopumilus sp.]|jgi:sulfite exporter TauE/SafE|nr:sulfite exporter TauE/SafE family protein [Candidatus Methylopumilus sp.]NBW60634.1 sulfite exporter TauE/SafE family protein [Methylophilaceae bacterium]
MIELSLWSAFLVAMLGGGHCIGMCGGLMMAVGMQLPQPKWLYLLTYNLGRISSYALAGALVGSLGQASSVLEFILPIQQILFLLSSLMLLLLGLYIANLWHGLLLIEKLGGRLWVRVEPWARKLLPIQHLPQAFFAGMLWGWLPCGLVYSVLIGALASGSAQNGAIMMLMFGLGTLPMLISLGFASAKLKPVLQSERLRMICGGMIAMFGIMGLYRLFW